jgi:hypothetical protein
MIEKNSANETTRDMGREFMRPDTDSASPGP